MSYWSQIVSFLSGVITGLLVFLRLDGPETTINENTRIGKIKQRGEGNANLICVDNGEPVFAKDLRQKQQQERRLLRQERRRERRDRRGADDEAP
jgi:hypothetical protein